MKSTILSILWLTGILSQTFPQNIPVTINTDNIYQTIEGFGGFGAKMAKFLYLGLKLGHN